MASVKPLHAVILAAGQGTRMKSALPKVLHPVGGTAMLGHVLATAHALGADAIHVVHGHHAEQVRAWHAAAGGALPAVHWVLQAEQLGTAHAVLQALPQIPEQSDVLVLYADVPLIAPATLQALRNAAGTGMSLLTAELADPTGYGRIVRDRRGDVRAVVEEKDASPKQRAIREVNTGFVAIAGKRLHRWLPRIGNANAKGEYYLTDLAALAVKDRVRVATVTAPSPAEVEGVNDRAQLAAAERAWQLRTARRLMRDGLAIRDPARFDLRGTLAFGRDVSIDAGVVLEGRIELADGVSIGPYCVLKDVSVGPGTKILPHSVIDRARIGANCFVGPFARLRPEAELDDEVHVGNFVEVKKSRLGRGTKANHLSYLGDATIGMDVNVGAGTITCNYDGVNKHQTVIGDGAFIGSDTALVAPVTVGRNATIGAGSVITRNAPDDALTVARSREQRTLPGWKRPVKK